MSNYDLVPYAIGTQVKITGGPWKGARAMVIRAYRIRFGHRMYDLKLSPGGHQVSYYAHDQLEET